MARVLVQEFDWPRWSLWKCETKRTNRPRRSLVKPRRSRPSKTRRQRFAGRNPFGGRCTQQSRMLWPGWCSIAIQVSSHRSLRTDLQETGNVAVHRANKLSPFVVSFKPFIDWLIFLLISTVVQPVDQDLTARRTPGRCLHLSVHVQRHRRTNWPVKTKVRWIRNCRWQLFIQVNFKRFILGPHIGPVWWGPQE